MFSLADIPLSICVDVGDALNPKSKPLPKKVRLKTITPNTITPSKMHPDIDAINNCRKTRFLSFAIFHTNIVSYGVTLN